ncbi:benzaldehyde dehydrogenase [Prauserella marina]|uniref:Benzaldehyde dehydrogenase (NAD) n=1 Tax=Prauserella marina TaxID=530584 RepID=A0A222VSW4_9PSEU|nr:benzaldehyde dehydrogenase [Prauserella marina]ASR36932.1 benzaldehyde dehydrogenase [Prauserella marina]PWV80118.1 benzaldehyde dehydrogenase (NAD) [Prauserella marina]SDD82817.1 benzaldehyde dehydrogenase (NAD) [Prauserella marina]
MSFLDAEKWHGRIFTGSWDTAVGGDATVVEPATGQELGRVGAAAPADVTASAARAAEAQRAWAATPFQERAAILRRAGELWNTHAAELKDWLIRESGSIPGKADFELHVAAGECFEASALPSHALGELLPSEAPRLSMAKRVPAGVVGVIAPFNAPLILSIRSVAPALALGNAVLLKPDPRTAVCGGIALARVFEEAGLPAGVFHVLPGGADVGTAMIEDPHVRVISFTGSTGAGRAVGELAGRHLKRAHLELGGNSAMIVLDDADVETTTSAAAWGSFFHQGQICMTTGRHLVHESLYDSYVERLAETAGRLPVGNPAEAEVALGPIIDERQRDKIHGLVTSSADAGARVAAGGEYEGLFYRPTVLAGAKPGIPAYDDEVFGPVAPVASFRTIEEAAELAAGSEYGLSLGILTKDVTRGLALAERIPTGIVHINDQTVNDEAHAPFGGVLASGTGSRFGGPKANIEAFTETRWITLRGDVAGYPF